MQVGEVIQKLQNLETIQALTPVEVADYLMYLSASLWIAGNETIKKEVLYNEKWNILREECGSDKHTDKRASLLPEYVEWKKAMLAEKVILQTTQSMKKKLRSLEVEYQNP